jgi:hypothetical protein
MNQRIRELAMEAGYMEDGFGIGHWDMPECKKFAALIIQDCINVIHKQDRLPPGYFYPKSAACHEYAIKEHFGAEE